LSKLSSRFHLLSLPTLYPAGSLWKVVHSAFRMKCRKAKQTNVVQTTYFLKISFVCLLDF
jgi:hypothetical protein